MLRFVIQATHVCAGHVFIHIRTSCSFLKKETVFQVIVKECVFKVYLHKKLTILCFFLRAIFLF